MTQAVVINKTKKWRRKVPSHVFMINLVITECDMDDDLRIIDQFGDVYDTTPRQMGYDIIYDDYYQE